MPGRTGIGATKRVVVGCVSKSNSKSDAERTGAPRTEDDGPEPRRRRPRRRRRQARCAAETARARIRRLHNGRDRASGGGGTGLAREILAGVVEGALRPARRERPARRAPAEAEARRARRHHAVADRAVASPFIAALVDDRRDNLSEVERPLRRQHHPGVDVPGGRTRARGRVRVAREVRHRPDLPSAVAGRARGGRGRAR